MVRQTIMLFPVVIFLVFFFIFYTMGVAIYESNNIPSEEELERLLGARMQKFRSAESIAMKIYKANGIIYSWIKLQGYRSGLPAGVANTICYFCAFYPSIKYGYRFMINGCVRNAKNCDAGNHICNREHHQALIANMCDSLY